MSRGHAPTARVVPAGVDVVELARELIRAASPNPPGDERAAAAVVVAAAESLGLPPARPVARAEHRPNLLTTLDFGPGGRHLVLSGHLDVAATVARDADGVVIGEPGGIEDDFDRLHLVSRGIARMRLFARADQGHSSLADELGFRNAGVQVVHGDSTAELARRFCEAAT